MISVQNFEECLEALFNFSSFVRALLFNLINEPFLDSFFKTLKQLLDKKLLKEKLPDVFKEKKVEETKIRNNLQKRQAIQRWDWDLIYDDLDGSLTDETNNVVVYNNNFTINDPNCKSDSRF
ncbi:hypothetical protein BpHYR1_010184, partial [Brachionus plicatilis]